MDGLIGCHRMNLKENSSYGMRVLSPGYSDALNLYWKEAMRIWDEGEDV